MRACGSVCVRKDGSVSQSVVNYNGQTCCYRQCLVGLSLVVGSWVARLAS